MLSSFLLLAQADSPLQESAWTNNLVSGLGIIATILAVFVLPFVIGRFISKWARMPNYGGRIGVIIASIVGSILILVFGEILYGVDIRGGTNLIYELDRSAIDGRVGEDGFRVTANDLKDPLLNRLNPAGTKELIVRANGTDQIEIIVPDVNKLEVEEIKRTIEQAGILEFRIVANRNDHEDLIAAARKQAEAQTQFVRLSRDVENKDGEVIGVWRPVQRDTVAVNGIYPFRFDVGGAIIRDAATGRLIEGGPSDDGPQAFERWLASRGVNDVDMLLALRRGREMFPEITGSDLDSAVVSLGNTGGYSIQFKMSSAGGRKLYQLTSRNRPDGNFHRRMAILLDNYILSAPQLNEPIQNEGQITGNFTRVEAEFLQKILNSGSLPAALNKVPISETQISATMGRDAISKGFYASIAALIATGVFILAYYRFAGLVASVALAINLLLIMAVIVLIKQPITLPGLAGLVLSVGMSVDANVLVFERIREEIAKKSTGRIAIRNGFDRALTTIIDSNLTTLISAIILYWFGTDQIRGFAVTLIIGLAASMFTAVFCSRVIFEVCDRLRLVRFGMADIVQFARNTVLGQDDINFMKYRRICYVISGILMLIGVVAPFLRGRQLLDIDFNGGTSVVFQLDQPATAEEIRTLTNDIYRVDASGQTIQTTLTSVQMDGRRPGTVFKLDTSLRDEEELTRRLVEGFEKAPVADLLTFEVQDEFIDEAPVADGEPTPETASTVRLAFQTSGSEEMARINRSGLEETLIEVSKEADLELNSAQIDLSPVDAENWTPDSDVGYGEWIVKLPLEREQAASIISQLKSRLSNEPVWESLSRIDSRVAEDMQSRAILALVISMLCIAIYIWFRFQRISYGLAALVALVHDILITLGAVAITHWLYRPLGFMMIEDFKISLTMIAAFLTIIGYSLNDTIVVFDRIREVKGKAPHLTENMINHSVNQTLGRTLLTSATTIVAVLLLYVFGGEAVHSFSYALFVGMIVGTYSSIFIAAPILLWFAQREEAKRDLRVAA